ncbi:AMP-binding protein [Variovorax sp. J22R133]|uniref:AMP-binding protein n=1 Tax=Variovorax brevis TaxID=3053503 RepID=UPI002577A7BC|nr:AMP-binding protein [Variovorax sp. J22R133]MDM0111300.1 AMP-binding protein [Variovorax sp. J22R133]
MSINASRIVEGRPLARALPLTTVPRFIREAARQRPAAPAMIEASTGRTITCAALDHQIGRVAAGLAAQGFRPGDTLLICSPNSPEWAIVALGAMAAGGRVSGANPGYTAAELAQQLRDSKARFAFTVPPLLDTVRQAAAQTGCERFIVAGDAQAGDALSLASLLACTGPEPQVPADPDALALLPFSSGTTGLPKGVMLTHRAIVANVCQILEGSDWPQGMVSLAFLPMFHAMGFVLTTLSGLAAGGTLVTLPRFEPEAFLSAIATHRVTHVIAVPPVMQFLAGHPMVGTFDLSSLRIVGSGGAPMGAALEARVSTRLKCPTVQGYGMTEVSAVLTLVDVRGALRPGSVGQVVPGTQARVVDAATGADVTQGEQGELWFRGPQLFAGYLDNPQATAATLTPDGWIRTGDIGRIDEDGFVFITDRLKELIKVNGESVAPAELEALLMTHPAVADAAVIGRPDERTGELPVAWVVPRSDLDAEALKAWFAERVAPCKRLADVVPVDAIPRNPAGKPLRRVLRARDAERMESVGNPA